MTQATALPPATKREEKSHRKLLQRFLPGILQTVVVGILVIAALEITFAMAGIGEEEFMKPDPLTGAEGIPHKSVTWRKEGFGRVHYNSFGMQDVERKVAKQPGTLRIACLGDSLVEALQVDRSQNFCTLIEKSLQSKTGRNCEVLNFGVSNSNIGQMLLRLRHKVWKFHPDAVAICIRPDAVYQLAPNPECGFITARPNFFLAPDGSLIEDMTVQRLWERGREGKRMRMTGFLREYSHIWGVVSKGVEQFSAWLQQAKSGTAQWGADVTEKQTAFKTQPAGVPAKTEAVTASGATATPAVAVLTAVPKAPAVAAFTTVPADVVAPMVQTADTVTKNASLPPATTYEDKMTEKFWPLAARLIQEIKTECDAHGARLIIVRLPAYDGWRNPRETWHLQQSAENLHASFVDTQPYFAEAAKTQQLFFNAHFRPAGHKVVADAMLKQVAF